MNIKTSCAVATIGLVTVSFSMIQVAAAQVTPTPAPSSKLVIPEKQGPSMQSGRSDSLSKKLDKRGGVIKPSGDIDPGMHVPAPDGSHTMPVIPPSATGGDSAK